jgi:membrane-associated phospholipid phosphatase
VSPAARWGGLAAAAAAAFLLLSALAAMTGPLPGDAAVRALVQALVTPTVQDVARWVNLGGSWHALAPAAGLLLLLSREARRRWWLWALALVAAPAVEGVWKDLVARPRPHASSFGFPSGHATAAAALGVILLYAATRVRTGPAAGPLLLVAGVTGPLAVGAARLVLDAHWLSDVVGGWLLGAAVAAGAAWWDARGPAPGPGPVAAAPDLGLR